MMEQKLNENIDKINPDKREIYEFMTGILLKGSWCRL